MLGAILGDIIGSPYEFDRGNKTTNFPLFIGSSEFTDDTVMTLAVAEGVMNGYGDMIRTEQEIISSMQKWGKRYPHAGYGARFSRWLHSSHPEPYNSFGNGSAMRVSSVAWLYDTLEDVERYAAVSAAVTHDHPEGIKGAQATAAAIFLAREGNDKEVIRRYIGNKYGYDFSRTCGDIRPFYRHVESCQETVPEAMTAFFEGDSFERVIRLAVSLGGDCDTLTAIAGSIAEGCYPISEELKAKAREMLDKPLLKLLDRFNDFHEKQFLKLIAQKTETLKILLEIKPYFDRCEKVQWESVKRENNLLYLGYPIYPEEVDKLNYVLYEMGLSIGCYSDVIDWLGVKKTCEAYKECAGNASPLLLNAMLTYVLRMERFCEGSLADAIESGVISSIITALISSIKKRYGAYIGEI